MSDVDTLPDAADPMQTAKDLFAGAAGGVAQVLIDEFGKTEQNANQTKSTIGQPFDIVKVRLQTTTQYASALDAARSIWTQEGPLAFYKGTLTPLIGIGACVSVQFGAFHFARRNFEARNGTPGQPLSLPQYYAAGAFAGLTNSVLSGPIEHVRIRLQTQPHVADPAQRLYKGPVGCIRTLVSQAGVRHGLYRGQAVTLVREAQAYGVWFLTYEWLMADDVRRRGLADRSQVEMWRLALYGGLAGEMLWLGSYPFDVVKSKMQTDGLLKAPAVVAEGEAPAAATAVKQQLGVQRYKNMRDCFAQTYREAGLGGFWKGIGPTLLRAMPVSAATFAVAEVTLRAIS